MMQSFRKTILAVSVATMLLALSHGTHASSFKSDLKNSTYTDNNHVSNTIVMLTNGLTEEKTKTLVRAVQGQLAEMAISLEVKTIPSFPVGMPKRVAKAEQIATELSAVAVFWCERETGNRIYLYLAAPAGGRVLVRRLTGVGNGELEEAVAIIVRSSIEAILAGGQIGIKSPSKIKSPKTEKKEPKQSKDPLLDTRLAYAYTALSKDFPVIHGAQFSLGVRPGSSWSLRLGMRLSEPIEHKENGFDITIWRYPIFGGVSFVSHIKRLTLGGTIAFEIDLSKEHTVSLVENAISTKGGIEIGLGIVAQLEIGVQVTRNIRLFLAPGAEIMLKKTDYVVSDGNTHQKLVEAWPVRPVIFAGIEIAGF